jgi:alkanesulfonate monooxygenase SsuD/methylene tetrahydromethanopterin reductase-like flavin-dependent oxidoreductase (luciferase family)
LLARFLTGLDLLSQGRVILGAGAGAIHEEFTHFGGPGEIQRRAEMLDESLEMIAGLASGEPFEYQGKYYSVDGVALQPRPFQQPRIPVWIGGESRAALRRAARWDGWMIGTVDENSQVTRTPEQLFKEVESIRRWRANPGPFDVAIDGISQPGERSLAGEYADAGATWWFEILFGLRGSHAEMLQRIKAGPP